MELREYLAIRRAHNLVRQDTPASRRLTFVELAILCRMVILDRPMNTSEIAEYQKSLRPTMTHRTKRLAELGFMERSKGSMDRRNVMCSITDAGRAFIDEVSVRICDILRTGTVLSRTTPQRIRRCIDAMGSVTCMSGDLVLLGILQAADGRCTISELVAVLGLLQPTASMSVTSLESEGLVVRDRLEGSNGRSVDIMLTEAGAIKAQVVANDIRMLVIRRKS